MTTQQARLFCAVIATCAMAGVQAQTSGADTSSSANNPPSATSANTAASTNAGAADAARSPYALSGLRDAYIGLSGGRSQYDLRTGSPGGAGSAYGVDDTGTAFKLTTGGFFHPYLGMELGYLHAGRMQRLGGITRGQGLNLSLIARAPLSQQWDVFGKLGTTYSRTNTSTAPDVNLASGKDSGFGLAYGAGVRWAFNPNWAAVLEWERHDMRFVDEKSHVDLTTVGVQYRY
jgi:OOP family OmpA-OmpF porin